MAIPNKTILEDTAAKAPNNSTDTNNKEEEQQSESSETPVKEMAGKREEVKFIKGDHQNGDAKIYIGGVNGAKGFTGMMEELMKYANDPFWVRLRWIFCICFWLVFLGVLVGAIFIFIIVIRSFHSFHLKNKF